MDSLMKKILIIFTALLFTGCALNIKYTPPVSGPIANIQFKNNSKRNLSLAFYKVSTGCKGRQSVQKILSNTETKHVTYAGKELTFQYYLTNSKIGGSFESYCLLNLRFLPKPNNSYIFSSYDDSRSCKWKMVNITNKEKPIEIKLKAIPWISGFDENSSFCNG